MEKINESGNECYICGGAVRDMVLGKKPHDIDLCTNLDYVKLRELFPHIKEVGKQFHVFLVDGIEIAQYRKESDYDGRYPRKVEFGNINLYRDSDRRDFTMNAMYMNIDGKIIDYYHARTDMKDKIIFCTGNSNEKMKEDYLRMIRAVRFAVNLEFKLSHYLLHSIMDNAHHIREISKERIIMEFKKVTGNYGDFLLLLHETGLLEHLFPDIAALNFIHQDSKWHPEGNVFKHTYLALKEIEHENFPLFMATMFHDIGKIPTTTTSDKGYIRAPGHEKDGAIMAREIFEEYKMSNDEIDYICGIISNHMKIKFIDEMKISKRKRLAAQPYIQDLIKLGIADCHGREVGKEFIEFVQMVDTYVEEVKIPCLLSGSDLISLGMRPGPEFGKILSKISELQLEGTVKTKAQALDYLYKYF